MTFARQQSQVLNYQVHTLNSLKVDTFNDALAQGTVPG